MATDTAFTTGLQQSGDLATKQWNPTLTSSTTYYWRVRVTDKVGNQSVFAGHTPDTAGFGTFTVAPPGASAITPPEGGEPSLTFPGDIDYDGDVDQNDVLLLGVYFGWGNRRPDK